MSDFFLDVGSDLEYKFTLVKLGSFVKILTINNGRASPLLSKGE